MCQLVKSDPVMELILTTLFRPNSDGLVKDDEMPPTVMEWVTRNRGWNL